MKYILILAACVLAVVLMVHDARAQQLSNQASKYHAFMPKTADVELQSLFDNPNMQWYTEEEMPKLFQHDRHPSSGRAHFISIYKDIGPGEGRNSNGNGEWPWAHPATPTDDGTVRNVIGILNTGVRTHEVDMPQYTQVTSGGRLIDVRQYHVDRGLGWTFSAGTEFIELNTNRIGRYDYTFKVHRMTMQGNGEWLFRVYRPFIDKASYEKASGTVVPPGSRYTMEDKAHSLRAFKESAIVAKAPPIDATLARKLLLETSFKLCTDEGFIPSTDHPNQIWPKGYLGPFLGNATNQDRCKNCHQDVAVNVRKFANGEWYGQIRGGGNDRNGIGVFSWHPTIRNWYGKGDRPLTQATQRTNQVRVIRQQQVRQFAPVRIQSGSS